MSKKKYIAFDLETFLINHLYKEPYGWQTAAPIPVCMSYKINNDPPQLTQDDMGTLIHDWLVDDNIVLLNQNVPFDAMCAVTHLGISIKDVFDKYNKGLVRDTMIREQLLALATGEAVRNPGKKYSLAALVQKYMDKDISASKGEDAWRLRYSELYDVPLEDWPQEAIDYPLDDVTHAMQVFAHQHKQRHLFQENELAQTRAALDLHLITLNSPRVDPEQVAAFKEAHIHQVEAAKAPLIKHGMMKWNKNRYTKFPKGDERREGYSMDNTKLKKAVQADYTRQGLVVPGTPKGDISLAGDTLLKCKNKHLKAYGKAAADIKLMDGFLPMLEAACDVPGRRVSPRYNCILLTGRTSCCVKHDTQVLTKEHGDIDISAVEVGMHVWTHMERWKPVTHTWIHPAQRMNTIKAEDGSKITCTTGHRFATMSGHWISAGELSLECQQIMGESEEEHTQRKTALQTKRAFTESSTDSGGSRDNGTQCQPYSKGTLSPRRKKDVERGTTVQSEDRRQEPDEGEQSGIASQIHRGLRGRKGVPDSSKGWEEAESSEDSNGRSIRSKGIASSIRCSSHRRGQTKQSIGQSSSVYQNRSSHDTLPTEQGFKGNYVQEGNVSGIYEVYDITVADDESYYAGGFFNHNSKPNMQNPPKAPGVRECFVPEDDHVFVSIDFSSMEMYALGQTASMLYGTTKLLDALNNDLDPHLLVTEDIAGMPYEDLLQAKIAKDEQVGKYRALGKIMNFGFGGGMGGKTATSNLADYEYKTVQELFPGEDVVDVMNRLSREWKEKWELSGMFGKIGNLCKGSNKPTYTCPITGRIKALNTYCQYANAHFQPIAADALKEALRLVTENCYIKNKLLNRHGCKIAAEIHDELLMSGPEDSLDQWVPYTQQLMEEGAMKLLPDCKIKTEAGVCGERWRKKDIDLADYLAGKRHE